MHDSSNVGANPSDIEAHAKALRAAGISWYKVLEAGGNKVERCRIYLAHDIMPIVRLYKERPHPTYVVFPGEVARYVAVGVRYFEMGNEPNISPDEWQIGKWPSAADLGRIIAEQWISASSMVKREGGIPLVYAMTPEGTYSHAGGHRRITIDFLQHLRLKGALGTLERAGVAIHPRPHNNPPDTPATGTNTVTFNEHQWFARTYQELVGWIPPMFATEHGYSIGDAQNANYPRIDENLWTDYNQELFERMNPSHPKAIPPYMFTLCYWLETAGGTWQNDELSRGWFPDGLRRWGQRFDQMNINWNRAIVAPAPIPTPPPPPQPTPTTPGGNAVTVEYKTHQSKHSRSREGRGVQYLILHTTESPVKPKVSTQQNTLDYFVENALKVSAHDYLAQFPDGSIRLYGLVPYSRAAHHAGADSARLPNGYAGTEVNLRTIGIEVYRRVDKPVPAVVWEALIDWAVARCKQYNLQVSQILSHAQVDPTRRSDPVGLNMVWFRDRVAQELGAVVQVPGPKPERLPLPEDEKVDDLTTFLQKATYWAEEHERQYVARQFAYASAIRLSLAKYLAKGRDKWST